MKKFQNSTVHRYGNVIKSNIRIENKKTIMNSTQKLGRVIQFDNRSMYNPFCDPIAPCPHTDGQDDHFCPIEPIVEEENEKEEIEDHETIQIDMEINETEPELDWKPPFCLTIEDPSLTDIYEDKEESFTMSKDEIQTPSIKRSGMETLRIYKKRSTSVKW